MERERPTEPAERRRADLVLSGRGQTAALRDYLRWAAPGVRLLHIPGGEDGPDTLALLAPPRVLLTAIGLLPGYLASRAPLSVSITIGTQTVTLYPDNLPVITPVLTRLLNT